MRRSRSAVAVVAVLAAACGGLRAGGASSPPPGDPATAPIPVAPSPVVPSPSAPGAPDAPAEEPTTLPAGLPDDCALLGDVDAALRDRLADGIHADVAYGPLVRVVVEDGSGGLVVATTTYEEPGVEGDSAAWTVVEGDVTAVDATAARISSFAAVPFDSAGEHPVASAVALAHDCSWVAADASGPPDPPAPGPSMRPDLLVVEPATARPGDRLALRFPDGTMRGIAFDLQRRTAQGWVTTHWMTSDGNGPEYAVTVPAGTEGFAVIDVGVGGTGPDHVTLPADPVPGAYRVCTANAVEDFCAPLTIDR